ncbi:hypothetical protein IWQ47_000694 [Aquimarina sp. EL_43]|uniref:hypothetical protein n=1 Tax=unclassified Aquimarina TaxID=2627091 RepID=UPI0018CB6B27|nr:MULTISPECIES: hypothetical protein [unclassified Aquimarina]MBG6128616.1 hypothetical protein [Aquimarina sp. EL_35]MBG6149679.1 hypothetical protein [Aquimarina sp. EL_32]MBG6167636.1 hypothetical protein [Aquimarina sp. EL_43]
MKKIFLTILILGVFSSNAQTSANHAQGTQNMFTANIIMPGLRYEVGLTSKTSLSVGVGTGFAWVYSDANGSEYGVFPNFEGAYRYYYNFKRRKQKGKRIANNSGNYLALSSYLSIGDPLIGDLETRSDYNGVVGPVWGIQRTCESKLNWNLELGVGYGFNDKETYISPIASFSIGWTFGKDTN